MASAVEAPATVAEGQTSHTLNQAVPSVYELMARVMRDVRNIGKNGRNESQNYSFRGVDDAIGALAQPLRDHGVVMTPEVLDFKTEVRGRQNAVMMRVAFHFHGPAGDKVTAVTMGEGSDFADKASNKAMSAALKYALIHTFMIPVDAKSLDDGDRDHPEGQRSAADAYMERLRKPAVWNNPTALLAMHTEAKADGLLGATVYAPGGEEMTLGELIVSRGTTLKREAAEREARQAAEAPEVAAQVAAETGVDPLDRLMEQAQRMWDNLDALGQIREEARINGISDRQVQSPLGVWMPLVDLLTQRIGQLKEQASQGGDAGRDAA